MRYTNFWIISWGEEYSYIFKKSKRIVKLIWHLRLEKWTDVGERHNASQSGSWSKGLTFTFSFFFFPAAVLWLTHTFPPPPRPSLSLSLWVVRCSFMSLSLSGPWWRRIGRRRRLLLAWAEFSFPSKPSLHVSQGPAQLKRASQTSSLSLSLDPRPKSSCRFRLPKFLRNQIGDFPPGKL